MTVAPGTTIHDRVKVGDRIRLIDMPDDPNPIPPGTEGTVNNVTDLNGLAPGYYQIGVDWDNNRSLSLVERDKWEIIR